MLEARELALEPYRCLPVCVSSSFEFGFREISKDHLLAVVHDLRFPLSTPRTPRNAFMPTLVISLCMSIGLLLESIGNAKVKVSIIEAVMIVVVALTGVLIRQPKNFSVHPYLHSWLSCFARELAYGVKSFRVLIPIGVPLPSREIGKAMWADFRELSLGQRDEEIRLFCGGHFRSLGDWVWPAFAAPDPSILPLEAA